eukprot:3472131-Rhodomonas_salina.1
MRPTGRRGSPLHRSDSAAEETGRAPAGRTSQAPAPREVPASRRLLVADRGDREGAIKAELGQH